MERSIRSFIAVEVSPEILSKVGSILSDLAKVGQDLRPVRIENMHFTIKFLGNIREEMIAPIRERMESVRHLLGFELRVGGLGAFPNARRARVLWVGASSEGDRMVQLSMQLDDELSKLGFAKERDYVPHLTLARSRSRRGSASIAEFLERWQGLDVGTMRVDAIVLKKSVLTPSGPIYSDLSVVESKG